jgi:type IV pilus assembly protein PilV
MIQSQRAQLESYQRVQALLLVQDMASRIGTNVAAADLLRAGRHAGHRRHRGLTTRPVRVRHHRPEDARAADLNEWSDLLKGSAELSGTTAVGAVLGARGCVTKNATTGVYQVSVAWQGVQAAGAPPAGITCGTGSYGATTPSAAPWPSPSFREPGADHATSPPRSSARAASAA